MSSEKSNGRERAKSKKHQEYHQTKLSSTTGADEEQQEQNKAIEHIRSRLKATPKQKQAASCITATELDNEILDHRHAVVRQHNVGHQHIIDVDLLLLRTRCRSLRRRGFGVAMVALFLLTAPSNARPARCWVSSRVLSHYFSGALYGTAQAVVEGSAKEIRQQLALYGLLLHAGPVVCSSL